MTRNQVIASSACLPPSLDFTLISSRGVSVGKKHQRLWPDIKAFQAEVPENGIVIDNETQQEDNQTKPLNVKSTSNNSKFYTPK